MWDRYLSKEKAVVLFIRKKLEHHVQLVVGPLATTAFGIRIEPRVPDIPQKSKARDTNKEVANTLARKKYSKNYNKYTKNFKKFLKITKIYKKWFFLYKERRITRICLL
jgi:hypothetical protein